MSTPVPETIGRYTILKEVGRGGMGVVYKAAGPDGTVAIKMSRQKSSVRKEAELLKRFDHPALLKVLDEGMHDGVFFFVTPFLGGGSLSERLVEEPTLPIKRTLPIGDALTIALTIAGALSHIHRRGWLHNDVKPENIRFGDQSEPYLLDFGVAVPLDPALREKGTDVGTPLYMAPERVLAPDITDGRADIYSLGLVLYEMLTGSRPFHGHGTEDLLSRILFWEPVPPRQLNPSLPIAVEAAILKAMDKCPARRYATAEAFARELETLRE